MAFIAALQSGQRLVHDGGMATQLEARGLALHPTLWSALAPSERPDLVVAVHKAYLDAGSDIISTCTYQTTVPGLIAAGKAKGEAEVASLLTLSVDLACEAILQHSQRPSGSEIDQSAKSRPGPFILASIACWGAHLADGSEFTGAYAKSATAEQLRAFHLPNIRALGTDPRVHALLLETCPVLSEAKLFAEIANEIAPIVPVVISLQCRDGATLAEGTPLAETAEALSKLPNVVALSVNCLEPRFVAETLSIFRNNAPHCAAMAYPNKGEQWDAPSRSWIPPADHSETDLNVLVPQWLRSGAQIIGGCCRTGPSEIRTIRALVDSTK